MENHEKPLSFSKLEMASHRKYRLLTATIHVIGKHFLTGVYGTHVLPKVGWCAVYSLLFKMNTKYKMLMHLISHPKYRILGTRANNKMNLRFVDIIATTQEVMDERKGR
jgi:hypothetical protein